MPYILPQGFKENEYFRPQMGKGVLGLIGTVEPMSKIYPLQNHPIFTPLKLPHFFPC